MTDWRWGSNVRAAFYGFLISVFAGPFALSMTFAQYGVGAESLFVLAASGVCGILLSWKYDQYYAVSFWLTVIVILLVMPLLNKNDPMIDWSAILLPAAALVGFMQVIKVPFAKSIALLVVLIALSVAYKSNDTSLVLLLSLLAFLVGVFNAQYVGQFVARVVAPLSSVAPRGVKLLAIFVTAYLLTAFYFAAINKFLFLRFPNAYKIEVDKIDPLLWGDWYFYSIYLLATGNMYGITPANYITKTLVAVEVATGVFWIVIYLGLILSHIDRRD